MFKNPKIFLPILCFLFFSGCSANSTNDNAVIKSSYFKLIDTETLPQGNISDPVAVYDKSLKPLISPGQQGEWDSVDVLNPSVLNFKGKLYNYYSGYDGNVWRTGVAVSEDGIHWEKFADNPVLEIGESEWDHEYIAANGSAMLLHDKIYYYYQSQGKNITSIGLAISDDGYHFSKENSPVLTPGEKGTWDSKLVGDPYVIEWNDNYYMYYLGMNAENVQKLGVAVSADGIHWTKHMQNPILDVGSIQDFDYNGLGEPSVIYKAPYFYMIYTGRSIDESRNLGIAISKDGIHFRKINNIGFIENTMDTLAWDSRVICDPSLIRVANEIYMYYGGGNKNEPAQNLNGQIGVTKLKFLLDWSDSKIDLAQLQEKSIAIEDVAQGIYSDGWASAEFQTTLVKKTDTILFNGWVPDQYPNTAIKSLQLDFYINDKKCISQTKELGETFSIAIPFDHLELNEYYTLKVVSSYQYIPKEEGISEDIRSLSYIFKGISAE